MKTTNKPQPQWLEPIQIPLPGGRYVQGVNRHGEWRAGSQFAYDSRLYQFIGRDNAYGLHAKRLTDDRLVVFESAREWKAA